MDNLPPFKKLKSIIKFLQSSILIAKVIEIVSVVFIGLATNEITNDEYNHVWLGIFIVAIIFYLIISLLQIGYNLTFPVTIADDLQARFELDETKRRLSRKTEIYDYLAQSIANLNKQTCNLVDGIEDDFCKNGLIDNLQGAIKPLIENCNYIFESNKSTYTIGIYMEYYLNAPATLTPPILEEVEYQESGTFLLKDDYNLEHDIHKNIMKDQVSGLQLQIKHIIEESHNNTNYAYSSINSDHKEFSIFSINIPDICDIDSSQGVLFIITENIVEPTDISHILRIFSQIIANLLSKQYECVRTRIRNAKGTYASQQHAALRQFAPEPEEVITLRENLDSDGIKEG